MYFCNVIKGALCKVFSYTVKKKEHFIDNSMTQQGTLVVQLLL